MLIDGKIRDLYPGTSQQFKSNVLFPGRQSDQAGIEPPRILYKILFGGIGLYIVPIIACHSVKGLLGCLKESVPVESLFVGFSFSTTSEALC